MLQGFRDRGGRQANAPGSGGNRHVRVPLQVFENAEHRSRGTPQGFDLAAVLFKQRQDAMRGGRRLLRNISDAGQEEVKPDLPITPGADAVQQVVVGRTVLLEVEAQVKDGFPQRTGSAQEKSDQQPPKTAIPIEEWVDGLELDM